jgi:hypothetical protein
VSASPTALKSAASSMESAATAMEPTATAGASAETAADPPAAAKASDASTADVVRVRNGPGRAATGCIARMVSRPEMPTVANPTVATISKTVAKVRSPVCIPW